MRSSSGLKSIIALLLGCVLLGLLIRTRSRDLGVAGSDTSVVQGAGVISNATQRSRPRPAILEALRSSPPSPQEVQLIDNAEGRNERASIHFAVLGLLNSPAKDTPECIEVWNVLQRNGVSIGSLARVYGTLFEMNAMSRVEESPSGKLMINGESFDKADPKHVEAINNYKAMQAFRFEDSLRRELPGLPPDEMNRLLSLRPTVPYRGGSIPKADLSRFLSLDDLPAAYRFP